MLSANKIYQMSGSSLPFKEWIAREKAKGNFIPNAAAMETFANADGESDCGCEEEDKKSPMFKNLVIVAVIGVLAYSIYKFTK